MLYSESRDEGEKKKNSHVNSVIFLNALYEASRLLLVQDFHTQYGAGIILHDCHLDVKINLIDLHLTY